MENLYSENAEQAVLGTLLKSRGAADRIMSALPDPNMFYIIKHQNIYRAMMGLFGDNKPIEATSVGEALSLRNELEQAGGNLYLIELLEGVATASNSSYYVELISKKATARQLIQNCHDVIARCEEGNDSSRELKDFAEAQLTSVFIDDGTDDYERIDQSLGEFFMHLDNGIMTGVKSGYRNLDDLIGRMPSGEVTVIAARPAMGKSALGVNIAENLALTGNTAVGFISLEMSREQLRTRMLSRLAELPSNLITPEFLDANKHLWPQLTEAGSKLNNCPLYVSDKGNQNMFQIRSTARRMMREHGIKCLVIDYLQYIAPLNRRADTRENVMQNCQMIKDLAKELKIPIVLLSQLNRKCEERMDKRPMMSDLAESGAIEQVAYVIMFIYREAYYLLQQYNDPTHPSHATAVESEELGLTDIIIAKNRGGQTGQVRLHFHKKYARFEEFAPLRPLHTTGEEI